MAQRSWLVVLLAVTGLVLACSTVSVDSDWDPHVSFANLHTWAWIPEQAKPTGDARLDDPLVHKRIRQAIADTLSARGYQQLEAGRPDFFVAYHVAITQKLTTRTIYTGYHPYGYWGGGFAQTQVEPYDEGTLLIDVIDPRTMDLIWRGKAQSRLYELHDPAKREARVREVVGKVLDRFPPKPAGKG